MRAKLCIICEIAFPLRPANTFREICVKHKKTLCEREKQSKFCVIS